MYKILVADNESAQLASYCEYLANSNSKTDITYVNNGTSALNAYNEIAPHAFVLDTKVSNINSYEVIDKLSSTKKESKICNIILTSDIEQTIFPISNAEKIYKIVFMPCEYSHLTDTINDVCTNSKIPELDEFEVQTFFMDLKFNLCSLSTRYWIEAIYQCYYYPHLLNNLDSIIKIISYKFNVDYKTVKFALRNALRPVNNYRYLNYSSNSFFNLFDKTRNITPKYFLEIATTYFRKKNRTNKNL